MDHKLHTEGSGDQGLYKFLVRDETLLTYDRPGAVNFASALQIQRVGDHAQIHSLHGEGFYNLLKTRGLVPFRERGIRYVQAAVSLGHLRLLKRVLRGIEGASIEDLRPCRIGPIALRMVLITDGVGVALDEEAYGK